MKRKQMSFVLHRAILPEILAKTEGEISRHFEKEISRLQLSAREKKNISSTTITNILITFLTFFFFVLLSPSLSYFLSLSLS